MKRKSRSKKSAPKSDLSSTREENDSDSASDLKPKCASKRSNTNEAGTSQTVPPTQSEIVKETGDFGTQGDSLDKRRNIKRKDMESENSSDSNDDDTKFSDNSCDEGWNSKKRNRPKRASRKRMIESDEKSDEENDRFGKNETRSKRRSQKINYFQVENDLSDLDDSFEPPTTINTPVTEKRRSGRPKKLTKPENVSKDDKTCDTPNEENDMSDPDNFESATQRRTSVTAKRRPGRPKKWTNTKISEGEETCDTPIRRRSIKKEPLDDEDVHESMDEDDSSSNNAMVKCQICLEEMKAKVYHKQHKNLHHGICWTQDEDPIDYFNPILVLEILGTKRKILQMQTGRRSQISLSFACFFCPEVKKSELGYYSHLLVCNRSDEDVRKANKKCDKCEKTIFLPHYHAHQLKHMKEEEVDPIDFIEPKAIEPTTSTTSDGKRSAARRAVSKISNISKNLLHGEDVEMPEKKRKIKEDTEFEIGEEQDELEGEHDEIEEDDDLEEAQVELKEEVQENTIEHFKKDVVGRDFMDESEDEYKDSLLSTTEIQSKQPLHTTFNSVRDFKFCYRAQNSLHSSKPLYEEFVVPKIEFLNKNVAENYLPLTKTSIRLQCPQKNEYQMDLFSANVKENRCILFTGGPVWAMAWCPQIFSEIRSDEYLAVASQPNINHTHEKNVTQSYKSVIQIWKVPQVSCLDSSDIMENPEMVLGIAHEEGAVWDLKWCPSGGSMENERLGILAAACSSGKVLLYAIPWLNDINGTHQIVSLEPVMVLQIDETNTTPCYNLAWDHSSPHQLLYAGYGDGFVAVFNIDSHGKLVLPIHLFQAHLTEVSVLSLSMCKDTSLLLTSGNDRVTKIWDLTNLTCPIQVSGPITQRKHTSGGFVPYLPLFIASSDYTNYNDQAAISQFAVRDFVLFKDTHLTNRFINQTSAHFTTTFSNYASSFITGSEDGRAYIFHYGSGLFLRGKQSTDTILESRVIELEASDDHDDEKQAPISSYEHAYKKYKIDFFSKAHHKSKKPLLTEECDIVNVTSSCWNNNVNNFRLIAIGQKCGFVHIMYSPLESQKEQTQFRSFLENLK